MKPLVIIIAILLAGMAVDLVALGLVVSHRHAIADRCDSLSGHQPHATSHKAKP